MGASVISTSLARTNLYFSLSSEPHLKAFLTSAKLTELTPSSGNSEQAPLPEGFIFPLDAIVALCGALEDEGTRTLIRFVGNNDFIRIDSPSAVRFSRVIRPGYAIFVEEDQWMGLGSQIPGFMASMVDFTLGRNALSILNLACYSNHRYSKRLARLLLEARSVMSDREEWIPLSQAEIGELMNTRRETIAIELLALTSEGVIETKRGRIRIVDTNLMRSRSCGCFDKSVALANHQLSIAKRMFAGVPSNPPATLTTTNSRHS
jgi:hypothetical protein